MPDRPIEDPSKGKRSKRKRKSSHSDERSKRNRKISRSDETGKSRVRRHDRSPDDKPLRSKRQPRPRQAYTPSQYN